MSRMALTLACGAVLVSVAACSDPAAVETIPVDDFELPEPDPSLDPGRLSVGEYIATPCAFGMYGDRLEHLRGRHEWALVDVYFGRASPESPWDRPLEQDVELVGSHGGRVLHQFNVPAVRARVLLSNIPDIVAEGRWVTVRDVPNPARYDVPSLTAGFHRLRDEHVDLYESLGGRVDHRWDFISALSGVLPDRSIPALAEHPDAQYVEALGVGCLG